MENHTPDKLDNNTPLYKEWVDFIVKQEKDWGNVFFYFESPKWELLWYIKTFYEEISEGDWVLKNWYIVDTVSAYKLEQNAPDMLPLFKKHWYTWHGLKGFWTSMYKVVLRYFQEEYDSDVFLQINAYEKNHPQIMKLLSKVQSETSTIIGGIRWWDDGYAAVVYLKKISLFK